MYNLQSQEPVEEYKSQNDGKLKSLQKPGGLDCNYLDAAVFAEVSGIAVADATLTNTVARAIVETEDVTAVVGTALKPFVAATVAHGKVLDALAVGLSRRVRTVVLAPSHAAVRTE